MESIEQAFKILALGVVTGLAVFVLGGFISGGVTAHFAPLIRLLTAV